MARNVLMPPRAGSLLGHPFLSLHREVNRLFDDVLRGVPLGSGSDSGGESLLIPQVNVTETDKEIQVTAELPGVDQKEIEINVNDDVLVIRAEKRVERKEEKQNVHVMERSYGTFQRALQLPFSINPQEVHARLDNGVLVISIPKSAPQQRPHRIEVQAGTDGQQNTAQTESSTEPTASSPDERAGSSAPGSESSGSHGSASEAEATT